MKKVAIMTWSHYQNYGTSLQVTASTYTIQKLGYDVNVINYIPHGRLVTAVDYSDISYYTRKLASKIKNVSNKPYNDEAKKNSFNEFISKHIKLTKEYKTDSDLFQLNNQYDSFVCGSDQIWAPSIYNSKYFLDFVEDT